MIYILDAYNVIHKIRQLETLLERDLRSARDGLIEVCGKFAAARGDVATIILVFDGKSEFRDLPQISPLKINLVFSETGEDADERIVKILEKLTEQPHKCVVSDDNFVRNHARAYQTRAMSVAEFERFIYSGNKKAKPHTRPSEDSTLPPKIAHEITEAYKKQLGID